MLRLRMFAATGFVLIAANVFAAKTDIVILRNGDRFTGEVKQLVRGQLRLSTDDVGTVYIEWDKIVSVTTALPYDVVTESGARYLGRLAPDTTTTMQVVADDGTISRLPFVEVMSFSAIKSGFFERIDGTVDLGGSYTKSSGVGQFSFAFDVAYRRPAYDVFSELDANLTRQKEAPSTSRFTFRTGYTHFRPNEWLVSPFVYFERNPDLGLTLRSAAALSVGRYLHQSPSNTTILGAGAAFGREQLTEGDALTNVDALIVFATSFYRYDYPRRNLDLTTLIFPELNRWGRVRAQANAKYRQELFRDFMAAIGIYDTFDSEPQVEGVHRNDFGVNFSLGWMF